MHIYIQRHTHAICVMRHDEHTHAAVPEHEASAMTGHVCGRNLGVVQATRPPPAKFTLDEPEEPAGMKPSGSTNMFTFLDTPSSHSSGCTMPTVH
jgi:nitrous oxide reductase accessory protein NosL